MNKQNNIKQIETYYPRPRENYAEWNVSLKLNLISYKKIIKIKNTNIYDLTKTYLCSKYENL